MRKRTILSLGGLFAVLVLSLATSGSSATRSIEVRGGPGVSASGRLTWIDTNLSSSTQKICDVTLRRTISRVIPKTLGTLFGKVTGITIDRGGAGLGRSPNCMPSAFLREFHDIIPLIRPGVPCSHSEDARGRLTYDCSATEARQWKLIYDGFQGTLPRIDGINFHIQGRQINFVLLEMFGGTVNCLYEGNGFGLISVNADGTVTRARAVTERTALARIVGSGMCPARLTWRADLTVSPTLTIALL